ncbi:enoyl-CoA hydratase-related protein [Metabacillus sp. GX 13764]|uniref:enoyl-CoA hydratase-related protein n=1 Tax=Metabacillus kandeliae TaxID=2900151 RepID=UPI001E366102|nr:enoyl-CoA hydratase-related protein [Metabacillus kandeliae]MCD7036466.1 enoyl-CoA hydratase-related protein [Metabacillus kandeliae]
MYESITFEEKNGAAWLTLNRPEKYNAFTEQMNKEITHALKKTADDEGIRCLVITGAGKAFCSGEDLSRIGEVTNHGEILRTRYNPMIQALARLEKPVVAAVNGVAAGAGMSLALACDFRLASEKASFIESFINVGLVPDSGQFHFLPKIVGMAKALELAILGEKISAQEAKKLGLVTKVIALDDWESETGAFAERLAAMPTKAIGLIKRTLRESMSLTLDEILEKEAFAQRVAGLTHDHQEGVTAFLEKREAVFEGK